MDEHKAKIRDDLLGRLRIEVRYLGPVTPELAQALDKAVDLALHASTWNDGGAWVSLLTSYARWATTYLPAEFR